MRTHERQSEVVSVRFQLNSRALRLQCESDSTLDRLGINSTAGSESIMLGVLGRSIFSVDVSSKASQSTEL